MKKDFSNFDTALLGKEETKKMFGGLCERTDRATLNGKKTNHHNPNDTDTTIDPVTDHCGG